jgi:recombination protein RecR
MSGSVDKLIKAFSRMPGIGEKTASRLTYHLLKSPAEQAFALAEAIRQLKENVFFCTVCHNITEQDTCEICQDPQRDRKVICVVEEPSDIRAIEQSSSFRGLYHVLGGHLSPLDGIGPEQLHIRELRERLEGDEIREVIVATNPTTEGETTALYLAKLIRPLGIRVTRIARGLPVGTDLQFADSQTLAKALEGRVEF